MNDYEKNCYIFIKKLSKELAQDFDTQYQGMDSFARWNLPEEIALEWIDAEGIIKVLEDSCCVSKNILFLLRLILNRFVLEFKKQNNQVWTFDSMKTDVFWCEQRLIAQEVLNILEQSEDSSVIDS